MTRDPWDAGGPEQGPCWNLAFTELIAPGRSLLCISNLFLHHGIRPPIPPPPGWLPGSTVTDAEGDKN